MKKNNIDSTKRKDVTRKLLEDDNALREFIGGKFQKKADREKELLALDGIGFINKNNQ